MSSAKVCGERRKEVRALGADPLRCRTPSGIVHRAADNNMKQAQPIRESKTLPLYAILCLWTGAGIFIASGLRDQALGSVVAGIGFLIYGASTYRDPVVFRTPLIEALRRTPVKGPIERGLDFIALMAVAGGLLLNWASS
jgi:hypothetical protein